MLLFTKKYLFALTGVFLLYFLLCYGSSTLHFSIESGKPIHPTTNWIFNRSDTTYNITDNYDLNGRRVVIPNGVTLRFNGGRLSNGTLIGDRTKLFVKSCAFDNVKIEGTWDCADISSAMFANNGKENVLREVLALANENVKNKIVIEPGEYILSVTEAEKVCLMIPSNTEFVNNGNISLKPNDLKSYALIRLRDVNNVTITGSGKIKGDRENHLGNKGEWGMGIKVSGSNNVKIIGCDISNVWGDCIYIGGRPSNVSVTKCNLSTGLRQGITITSAKKVLVDSCTIKNIGGKRPGYAIDLEPNKYNRIEEVIVRNCIVDGCDGGFKVCEYKEGAHIGNVEFENCILNVRKHKSFSIVGGDLVRITRCSVENEGFYNESVFRNTRNLVVSDVNVIDNNLKPYVLKRCENNSFHRFVHRNRKDKIQ